jgi:dTDP-glucose 4,6-dehydratase
VEGIYRLLISDFNQPVNLGNPHEMTILEMAETILRKTGSKSKIDFKPLPEDDPKVRQPNIDRARELLNWSPQVTLEDGLNTTIEYFRKKMTS